MVKFTPLRAILKVTSCEVVTGGLVHDPVVGLITVRGAVAEPNLQRATGVTERFVPINVTSDPPKMDPPVGEEGEKVDTPKLGE